MRHKIHYIIIILTTLTIVRCAKVIDSNNNDDYPIDVKSSIETFATAGNFDMLLPDGKHELVTLPNGLVVDKIGDLYYLEGDMVFNDSTLARLANISLSPGRSAATNDAVKYWPKRIVPYTFDASFPSYGQYNVQQAMSLISNATGVIFTPATSSHTNKILFMPSTVNNSSVGMVGGTQIINLYNYNIVGIIMHEIMHALGFFHEHTRQDRDNHILVNTSNIKPAMMHNFNKYSAGLDIGPFDFNSIMLYGSYTSDANFVYDTSQPMLTKLDYSTFVGQRDSLSQGDIVGIKSIYGPPFHSMQWTSEVITNEFYNATEIYEYHDVFKIIFTENNLPANLAAPRNIRLKVRTMTATSNHQLSVVDTYQTITVPSGVSEYLVADRTQYERYEWGDPYEIDVVEYYIVNTHY